MVCRFELDSDAFLADWVALASDISVASRDGFKQALDESAQASTQHGYKNRTGQLSDTREVRAWSKGGFSFEGEIRWPARYAKWVDDGRGPVYPIRAKCLRWYTPAGVPVFRKYAGPSRPARFSAMAEYHLAFTVTETIQGQTDSAIARHP